MFQSRLIINGEPREPAGGVFERRGPESDHVVTQAAAARAGEAASAAAAAAAAFERWSHSAASDRAAILLRAADLMQQREEEVVAIARQELGASAEWVRFNNALARGTLAQAATLPALMRDETETARSGIRVTLRRRPAGVVLCVAPWNAAVTLATRAVAAPLACGNTVVMKASELCPKTHEWVARALIDAGLPPGVLNFLTNAPDHAAEVMEALVAHPAIRRVNFTGSTRVGREIAVLAARHLKPCLLELSGKGTMIVLDDADLDHAAEQAAHAAFFNQGQICMSAERIIVDDRIADPFLSRLRDRAEGLRTTRAGGGPLGSMVIPGAAVRLRAFVDDALSRGAELVTGGDMYGPDLQPTLLDRVAPGMRLYDEEAFGPIAGVIRVGDADEALALANDTDFGLVAAVFTRDTARGMAMLREIETGIGHLNRSTVFDDPAMPFGGVKASGHGWFGGRETIREFTELQVLTEPPAPGAP
ncbi:MAG: aldehyde dehydrogenase family protein [Pseudooceanicola sp.]|nr:aldehyde dehydrogenase family protein [Pseudooceanicola sp.]